MILSDWSVYPFLEDKKGNNHLLNEKYLLYSHIKRNYQPIAGLRIKANIPEAAR